MTPKEIERILRLALKLEGYLRAEGSPCAGFNTVEVTAACTLLSGLLVGRYGFPPKEHATIFDAGVRTSERAKTDAAERFGAALATGDDEEIRKAAALLIAVETGVQGLVVAVGQIGSQKGEQRETVAKAVDEAVKKILEQHKNGDA